ncbi:hypothetical protein A2478_01420 [Candidatus Falkowbacteria bacterium RIFOXYC2_FULL_36_12]|uniref:Phosphoenolpyruvate synthase n=1 Tax=Candidatus Falkowbacteria bacterium RIFOXYC2_FULL_36_12 TaxID=1798002 RepID=A0A1F5T3M6_9BACT|nr:MAG: hypothetical protein A2478_01420 [Candidatus Falkowbacteria bacterium RIFOXYC2_FULL_36_12]
MFCKKIKKINKSDVKIAGGKGASLGEMINNSIPVPDGFVVLSNSFEKFLEVTDINVEIDAQMDKANSDDVNSIDNASKTIESLIIGATMPDDIAQEIEKSFSDLNAKYVAVRSSATAEDSSTASWAGELESYLFVNHENLLDSVKKCWASLFTPRAIHYRIEQGLKDKKVSVAVVIQKMIDSEISGITFTVHPVTQDKNQMIIEAIFGQGEAIVGGLVTPDSYVVDKETMKIIDQNISVQKMHIVQKRNNTEQQDLVEEKGSKQKLSEEQILEIAEICKHIEEHYEFPCDIEWAFARGEFYIVQSRPITTLV